MNRMSGTRGGVMGRFPVLVSALAVALLAMAGCRDAALERAMGTPLPDEATRLKVEHGQPNPDLAAQVWYVRFEIPEDDFRSWARKIHLENDPACAIGPFESSLAPMPHWWQIANRSRPPDCLYRHRGEAHVRATWADGLAYLIVEQIPPPSPGPW